MTGPPPPELPSAVVRRPVPRLAAVVQLARPHQWSKNLLLLLPAFAGHMTWTLEHTVIVFQGFMAFSLVSSAGYIVNDLYDIDQDRLHPTKRHRPLASGALSPTAAALTAAGLAALALVAAVGLPLRFLLLLGVYATGSILYSLQLRQRLLVDVMTLAALYTLRVIAGGALVEIALSRWFLPFSVLFFLSLALVKRVTELKRIGDGDPQVRRRAYVAEDVRALGMFGAASSVAAALVYCLYISSPDITRLYRAPELLWGGLPLILYWQARIWIFALRGELHDDPVLFTLRDRVSLLATGAFLGIVWLAA